MSENPVSGRGITHWIMYEFDNVRSIQGIKIWNHPNALGFDIREMTIDYSMDGTNWTELGSYELPLASGSSLYEGVQLEGIEEFQGKFVVLTALSNYGGTCTGLGEIRFNLNELTTSVEGLSEKPMIRSYPNPFSREVTISLSKLKTKDITYVLYDALGREVISDRVVSVSGESRFTISGDQMQEGFYFLTIVSERERMTRKLAVVHPR